MKSLAEHGADKMELHRLLQESHRNGIACPTCGKELWDTNPTQMLTSNPPRVHVHCPACGYAGNRIT